MDRDGAQSTSRGSMSFDSSFCRKQSFLALPALSLEREGTSVEPCIRPYLNPGWISFSVKDNPTVVFMSCFLYHARCHKFCHKMFQSENWLKLLIHAQENESSFCVLTINFVLLFLSSEQGRGLFCSRTSFLPHREKAAFNKLYLLQV